MKKTTLNIGGMHCAACSSYLEKELSKNKSIENANVSIATNTATFEYDESVLSIKDIDKIVKGCGFYIDNKKDNKPKKSFDFKLVVIIVFALSLMYVSMGHMLGLPAIHHNMMVVAYIQLIILIPVLLCGGDLLFDGFKALFKLHPNMNSLVAIGSLASIIYSLYTMYTDFNIHNLYFESSATIDQYSTGLKFLISFSLSTTSLSATD